MKKIVRKQLKKGLVEGDRVRLGIGITGLALLFLFRILRPRSQVIWRHRLKPGERLTLRLRPRA